MTAQEIINQAKIEIRQLGTSGFTDSEMLKFVEEADIDFSRFTEVTEKLSTVYTTANESLVSMPSDFLEGRQTRWSYNLLLYPKTQRQLYYDVRDWPYQVAAKPMNVVYWNYNVFRMYPIPSAAGTLTIRHAYVDTTPLQLTSTPVTPKMWHPSLVDFVVAECFYAQRKYDAGDEAWMRYIDKRSKAKMQFTEGQRTPDTIQSMRPKSNFNWQWWNQRTT